MFYFSELFGWVVFVHHVVELCITDLDLWFNVPVEYPHPNAAFGFVFRQQLIHTDTPFEVGHFASQL